MKKITKYILSFLAFCASIEMRPSGTISNDLAEAHREVQNTVMEVVDGVTDTIKNPLPFALEVARNAAWRFGSVVSDETLRHISSNLVTLAFRYACMKLDASQDKTFEVIKPHQIQERFSSIGGYNAEKDVCKSLFDYLKDPTAYMKQGSKIIKGLLLTGAPGTGKTLFAKALAGQMGCPLIMVSAGQLIAGEQSRNTGPENIKKLFELARKWATIEKPCIVFIDEVDAIGKQRKEESTSNHTALLTSLLAELDVHLEKKPILFIATTNHKNHLDAALLRAGRIDLIVDVKLPSKQDRVDILKVHLQNVPHQQTINLAAIADRTPSMSGADLAHIVQIALRIVMEKNLPEITDQELQQALNIKLFGSMQEEFEHPLSVVKSYHQAARAVVLSQKESHVVINSITIASCNHKEQKFEGVVYTAAKPACITEQVICNEISEYLATYCVEKIFFGTNTDIGLRDRETAKGLAAQLKAAYGVSQTIEEILEVQEMELCDSMQQHKKDIVLIAQTLLAKKILYGNEITPLLPLLSVRNILEQQKPHFRHAILVLKSLEEKSLMAEIDEVVVPK